MSTQIPTAQEIVRIMRGVNDADAAALVQKYADATASIWVAHEAEKTHRRVMAIVEGGFNPARDSERMDALLADSLRDPPVTEAEHEIHIAAVDREMRA